MWVELQYFDNSPEATLSHPLTYSRHVSTSLALWDLIPRTRSVNDFSNMALSSLIALFLELFEAELVGGALRTCDFRCEKKGGKRLYIVS